MTSKINRISVGAICNRDIEVLEKIKNFLKINYSISTVNFLKNGISSFNNKSFKKKLKKKPISFLIVKLTTQKSNNRIYNVINSLTPTLPILNSLKSVHACESRRATFRLIMQNSKKLNFPKTYFSISKAYQACCNGINIIIKLNAHNIPNLPKSDRIIGIARNPSQFIELTKYFIEKDLFFQEYLGKFDKIYKVYVIGKWAVSITSHDRLQKKKNLSPLELIHIRVPIEKQFKRRIVRMGRKIGMSVFGVDYILSKDEVPYIIDVNDCPSFRSIPEAVSLISHYVYNNITMQQQIYKTPVKLKV